MLSRREYEYSNVMGDEKDVCIAMEDYLDVHFCDAVSEVADNAVPIYTYDIWCKAVDVKEYIEDAISEGLVELRKGVDLESIFQAGYYRYYETVIYDNLENIAYNVMCNFVENEGFDVWDGLEDVMDELAGKFNSSDKLDSLLDELEDEINEYWEGYRDANG